MDKMMAKWFAEHFWMKHKCISPSTMLPEEGVRVLVSVNGQFFEIGRRWGQSWWIDGEKLPLDGIKCWMPLPIPYESGGVE